MILHVIGRRRSFARVLAYLAGPGRDREHVDPQIVAGDRDAEPFIGELDKDGARLAAEHLDSNRVSFASRVKEPAYHFVIGVKGDEISAERWQEIRGKLAEAAAERLGFERSAWVAADHGVSKNGHHHVHVVASMVKDDGKAVRLGLDRPRAKELREELQREFGLQPLAVDGTGLEGMPDLARGRSAAERDAVALRVRAAHVEAGREDRFPARLREHGVEFEARRAQNGRVTGAKYRLPGGAWYQGSKLANDLSLPRMREAWRQPSDAQAAAGAWASLSRQHESEPGPIGRASREVSRSAQTRQPARAAHGLKLASLLANPEKGPAEWLLIGAAAFRLTAALHQAHVERGHHGMAAAMDGVPDAWAQAKPGLSDAASATERSRARRRVQDRSQTHHHIEQER